MPKSIYTPFTYLIRLVLAQHLVLSVLDTRETVILMTSGLLISHRLFMSLFKDGSMVNRILPKYDELFKLKKKHENGKSKFLKE